MPTSSEDLEKGFHESVNGPGRRHSPSKTTDHETDMVPTNSPRRRRSSSQSIGAQLEMTTSARSAVLSQVNSRRHHPSRIQPGPPPDGGLLAWTQVAMGHLTIASTFGYITSFGVFQTYYESTLDVSSSAISWIGAMQIFLLFLLGTFSGRALDAGLFHHVYITGSVFQLLAVFTTAECKQYWQFLLAQGLCQGLSNGLQFTPTMSLVSTYFSSHRSLALGFVALGSCTGGVFIPVIVQQAIPRIGFSWTVRIIGFLFTITNVMTICFYRTRLPPRKSGPLVEWAAFRESPYSLFIAAMFFNFWGLYFALFYIGSFGRDRLGVSYKDSINLLITVVSVGFIARILPNYIADRTGPLNALIPFAFLAIVAQFSWIAIADRASLFVFAVFYGIAAGAIQGVFPATLTSLTTDISKTGVRMGMGFSVVAFASLSGPPLAGALIQAHDGDYLYAQIWGGLSFLLGSILLVACRVAKVGWKIKQRT